MSLRRALLFLCLFPLGQLFVKAQPNPAFGCVASAANPPTLRAEGLTELATGVILDCTGFPSTAAGLPVPLYNFQINSTAPLTSDAVLLVNEPSPNQQKVCTNFSGCPATGGPAVPNVFPGQLIGEKQVTFLGIPVYVDLADPKRTSRLQFAQRIIAAKFGLGKVDFTLDAQTAGNFVNIPVTNATQTGGVVQPGLIVVGTTPATLQQCVSLNAGLLSGGIGAANTFNVTVREGFASSFRRRNIALPPDPNTSPAPLPQNIPGFAYNTETGFYNPALSLSNPGLADFGTRIRIRFLNIGTGSNIFAPAVVPLIGGDVCKPGGSGPISGINNCATGFKGGVLRLIGTSDTTGVLPFTAAPASVTFNAGVSTEAPAFAQGANIPISGGVGAAIYEVVNSDPDAVEQATIPVSVAFISNTAQNLPAPGASTVNVSFAPTPPATGTAAPTIPRFASPTGANLPAFTINPCTGPAPFTVVSSASYGTSVAPNSFASGFGASLATVSVATPGLPLGNSLGGFQVQVTDSKGLSDLGLMHYVSPTQFNFVVPPNTAPGQATVKVLLNGQVTAQGTVQVDNVAPGLFALDGIAAAQILRIKPDTTSTYDPTLNIDPFGFGVYNPVTFAPPAGQEQVYFIGYGTGFRNNSGLPNVSLTIGSTPIPVSFAGPQGTYPGLDQLNAGPLPISLAGSGEKVVNMTVDGKAANAVKVFFKQP